MVLGRAALVGQRGPAGGDQPCHPIYFGSGTALFLLWEFPSKLPGGILRFCLSAGVGHPYGDSRIAVFWTASSISLFRALSSNFHHTSMGSVIQGCHVLITTFNTTVVSFISKQGGTYSLSLLCLAVDLLMLIF